MREYWQINNVMLASEMILFTIEREEVEASDVSRVKDSRSRLVSSRELALHCKGRIEFSFNGYDDDSREMFEIEEAKRYVAQLDDVMLELFLFVRTEPPAHTLSLFVFSLFGVGWQGERSVPGKPGKYIVDIPAMTPFVRRHFGGLNFICKRLEIPEEEIARISIAVMKHLVMIPMQNVRNRQSTPASRPSMRSTSLVGGSLDPYIPRGAGRSRYYASR